MTSKNNTSSQSAEDLTKLIAGMNQHRSEQLELCKSLEDIADSLPDSVEPQICLQTARALYPAVKSAHDFEEKQLFPILDKIKKADPALDASMERLRYEHWEDESYSQELTDVLLDWAKGGNQRNPEATGYMLRGFFEGLRRHIAFEMDHIIPLIQKVNSDPQQSQNS